MYPTEPFIESRENVKIFRLQSMGLFNSRFPIPYSPVEMFQAYRQIYLDLNCVNLVQTRFFSTSVLGALFSLISKTKLLVFEHGSDHISFGNAGVDLLFRSYEHLVTKFISGCFRPNYISISEASRLWLRHFGIDTDHIVPNAVNPILDAHGGKPRFKKKYLFFASRLIKEKGIIELIEAFLGSSLVKNDYSLLIAGSGSLGDEIILKSQKEPCIKYLGKLTHRETMHYLKAASALFLPSNYPEGLPTILLEAGMLGIPIFTTPKGGSKEIILHKQTGYLMKTGSVKEIQRGLEFMFNNPNLMNVYSGRLKKKILSDYTWQVAVNKLLSYI